MPQAYWSVGREGKQTGEEAGTLASGGSVEGAVWLGEDSGILVMVMLQTSEALF